MMTLLWHPTSLGDMLLAAAGETLVGAWFRGQKHFPQSLPASEDAPAAAVLAEASGQLDAYLAGRRTAFDLALAPRGTAWQHAVWEALRAIPYGETLSYGQLATRLGKPAAARATGAAVGRNPLSILIPCHRVLGATGGLTGYAGGLDRKRALLALEQAGPADRP
ncbi:MAG: methylated-DNA--[protein]-cysteine S-methyltransferase [Solidesulfovibrio sp. DCME]|uniref:methylated-DNA--[protein]-cysteine S-methyltransferase n=1 Tax=Solidesulfovibrio sp. DCME TaxID=3447380 RepID=UPI003D0B67E5